MTLASRVLASLLMGLLLLTSPVQATPPSPRIGLVLGGGGARGFAHLGILAELERLRIPVACMAGTSAGALVGGFYAAGLSPDTIQQAFDHTDWDRVLSGQMERAELPFRRKRDDYRNYFDLLTGFRDGSLRFPRAAVSSQHIDQLLHRITGDVVVDSFEHLPYTCPFRFRRLPPTCSPAIPMCLTTVTWPLPSAPAWRCRGCLNRWNWITACWWTVAWLASCRWKTSNAPAVAPMW
jgi:hypothetical protein